MYTALIDTDALIGDLNASFDGGADMDALAQKQSPEKSKGAGVKQLELDEKKFRCLAMATEENRGGHS